jgi:succinyl-diaminopimelate desuccinylase
MNKFGIESQYHLEQDELCLEVYGVSAHGMEPNNGKNAGLFLAEFLAKQKIDAKAAHYFQFVSRYFFDDSRGRKLGIFFADELSGDLTINAGILSYSKESTGKVGVTVRYPVTNKMEETKDKLDELVESEGFSIENFKDSKPHFVDEKEFLIQTLKKVYEEQMGEEASLIAIGGGTYARSLKTGVAFGPLFPGRPDIAHQKDEYMILEDLVKATAIYAQAIYELANKQ